MGGAVLADRAGRPVTVEGQFMQLAYVDAPLRGETNRLLAGLAGAALRRGLRVCGTVQFNHDQADGHHCDMDVEVLPAGPLLRISQSLGTGARGCRLNPETLEQAVEITRQRMAAGCDLLIVNKFGKHEAEGRGFRAPIAEALGRGIPVIVGVNGLNRAAFEGFSEGLAQLCAPQEAALAAWLDGALAQPASG